MSPRGASVNEESRRRSRERPPRSAVELADERGYAATMPRAGVPPVPEGPGGTCDRLIGAGRPDYQPKPK
ncbi:hypothetical protein [Streptomyces adelaidensis]|uniref:hypothetical protein n=1 Tax=Streptomyces adelaidensis TaxID=2796465 RepID=UPI0035571600